MSQQILCCCLAENVCLWWVTSLCMCTVCSRVCVRVCVCLRKFHMKHFRGLACIPCDTSSFSHLSHFYQCSFEAGGTPVMNKASVETATDSY